MTQAYTYSFRCHIGWVSETVIKVVDEGGTEGTERMTE